MVDTRKIFGITSQADFETIALNVFQYQYQNNTVYRAFCNHLGVKATSVRQLSEIPFLPIEFFKKKTVLSSKDPVQTVFTSSGTTGTRSSKHYVTDIALYEQSYTQCFHLFYEDISGYCVLALLPSYLEREGSSLIYMVDDLIQKSGHPKSGFYLNDLEQLSKTLSELDNQGTPILLIGVSFALLDMIEKFQFHLQHTIVMETGGMKGRRRELIREELHQLLKDGFGVKKIHSEYGMTELLSQAYSNGDGMFRTPPWMRVLVRDTEDPLSWQPTGKTGGINIIDLANVHSCSFLATQDLGKAHADGYFEILGRFDHSDIRGCNLMVV